MKIKTFKWKMVSVLLGFICYLLVIFLSRPKGYLLWVCLGIWILWYAFSDLVVGRIIMAREKTVVYLRTFDGETKMIPSEEIRAMSQKDQSIGTAFFLTWANPSLRKFSEDYQTKGWTIRPLGDDIYHIKSASGQSYLAQSIDQALEIMSQTSSVPQ